MREILALLLLAFASPASAYQCPAKAQPGQPAETALDCPWAGAARDMRLFAASGRPVAQVFEDMVPGVLAQADADSARPRVLALWGKSLNFDELANGEIVDRPVLDFLASRLGLPAPEGRVAHAGMEHTYGYLFSLLGTKFGYKRARWVEPDIEDGLGLPRGMLGPAPAEGTLLLNVTCLAGGFALRDDAAAMSALAGVCPAPVAASSRKLRRQRLTETAGSGGRTVVLRTDFIPFSRPSPSGNAYLLVYSVQDGAAGGARLITAFPVNAGFVKSALDPAGLGPDKPVSTRYNAFVEGLTGSKARGRREAVWLD